MNTQLPVYVDTSMYVAFLSPGDNLHEDARELAELLEDTPTVTSEPVLVEV